MSFRFIRSNGVTLCYRDHPGGEPTLVLLPGLTVSGAFFDPLVTAGLSPLYRCVAFDLRGRGRSDAPPGGLVPFSPATNYTMPEHATDVLGAMDALAIRRPVLVGHSFGGMLALFLAAYAPGKFAKIVLLDAAISLASEATKELLRPSLERLDVVKPSWDDYITAVRRLPYLDGWWDTGIENYFRDDAEADSGGGVRARARPDAIRAAVAGLLAVDWPAVLARVETPAMLVNAEGPFGPTGFPPFLPKEAALATAKALKDCRFETVSGNHITMLHGDHACEVASAVASFVEAP